eukprot:RCo000372
MAGRPQFLEDAATHLAASLRELHNRLEDVRSDPESFASLRKAADDVANGTKFFLDGARESITPHFRFLSWNYLSRLLFSIALFVSCSSLNALSSQYAGFRNPRVMRLDWQSGAPLNTTTLPDLGHDVIAWVLLQTTGNTFVNWFDLPDLFVAAHTVLTGLLLVFHTARFLIQRRLFVIFALLNLLRAYTVVITSLPDPSPVCQLESSKEGGLFAEEPALWLLWERAVIYVISPGTMITCGDMIFSGHSTFQLVSCCVWMTYFNPQYLAGAVSRRTCFVVRVFMLMFTIVGCLAVVATRLHYTLDVSLAVFLTVMTWKVYHVLATTDASQRIPVLRWLEAREVRRVDSTVAKEM